MKLTLGYCKVKTDREKRPTMFGKSTKRENVEKMFLIEKKRFRKCRRRTII